MKPFKNLTSLVLFSGVFLFLLCLSKTASAADNVLNIYTWAGYLSDAVISQFEVETGIRVNVATYVNNEVLYAKLKANPDSGYDIIMPSSYFISRLRKHALIQKIDHSKLAHYQNINPLFLSK